MSAAPSSEPSHTVASMKRILAAISSVTLALAVGAMGPASPAHARGLSPYEAKLQGLGTLQSAAPSANEFSLTVAPQVGWDAGLESLRPPPAAMYRLWDMDVAWRNVNPARGVFDWSILDRRIALVESWGGRPFLVLGLTPQWAAQNPEAGDPRWGAGSASPPANIEDWKTYVRAVANRYGGRIAGYELWNEANLPTFWQGSSTELLAMAQDAYGIIKAANPGAVVAAPSITTRLRGSAARFTSAFAGEVANSGSIPFDTWTIHSYPNGDAGGNVDAVLDGETGKLIGTNPEVAVEQRIEDVISWQNALVDALGPGHRGLSIGIYDTEVNYGLAGPGIRPGTDWSIEDGNRLMDWTFQSSRLLGIHATFWYQYTAENYPLLGVQWSSDGGNQLSATWDAMRASGPSPESSLLQNLSLSLSTGKWAVPVFKSCFIRAYSSCAGDNLGGVDFTRADLSRMDFTGAYMKDVKLIGTRLIDTNFTDAYMKGANFRKANGIATKLGARSLADANFSEVSFWEVEATGKFFGKTNWKNATVKFSDFSSSNFYKSNFEGASILNTDMRATKLRGVSWKGAKVKNSVFAGAVGNKP